MTQSILPSKLLDPLCTVNYDFAKIIGNFAYKVSDLDSGSTKSVWRKIHFWHKVHMKNIRFYVWTTSPTKTVPYCRCTGILYRYRVLYGKKSFNMPTKTHSWTYVHLFPPQVVNNNKKTGHFTDADDNYLEPLPPKPDPPNDLVHRHKRVPLIHRLGCSQVPFSPLHPFINSFHESHWICKQRKRKEKNPHTPRTLVQRGGCLPYICHYYYNYYYYCYDERW